MKKVIIILILALFSPSFLIRLPATDTYKNQVYNAFLSGNLNQWKKVIDEMHHQSNGKTVHKLELLNYQYGYIGNCLRAGENSDAEAYMEKAETLLELLEKTEENRATVYAYQAAFVGFKIAFSPAKAPFIGNKVKEYAKKAMEIDSNNFLANLTWGNIEWRSPAAMGGDKEEALKYYISAIRKIENHPELLRNNWQYISVLVQLAELYQEVGQNTQSKGICEKILEIEPNMVYVRDVFYPKLKHLD